MFTGNVLAKYSTFWNKSQEQQEQEQAQELIDRDARGENINIW